MSDAALSGPLSVLLAGFSSPLPFDSLIPEVLWPWRLPDKTISHFETSEALMILHRLGFQLPPNFETWSAVELSILPTWMLPQSLPAIPDALPFHPLDRILSPDRKEHPLFRRSTFISPASLIAESDLSPVEIVASPDILPAAPTSAALAGSSALFDPTPHGSVPSSNIADVVADEPSPHPEPLFLPGMPEPDSPDFVNQSRNSSPIPTLGLGPSSLPIAETNAPAPLRRMVIFPKTRCLLPEGLEPAESLDITWEIQAALKVNKVLVQEDRLKLKSPYDRPSYNFSSTPLSSQLPATASSPSNAVPSLPQASSNLDEVPIISEASNMGLDIGVHPPLNPAFVNAPSVVPSSTQGWFIPTGLLSDGNDIISPTSAPAADGVMLDVGSRDDSMGANVGLSNDVGMSDFEMPAVDRDNECLANGEETFAFVEEVRELKMLLLDDLLDLSSYDDDMEIDELLPSETGMPMVRELSLPPVATLDVSISLPLAIPMPQPATTSFLLHPAQFTPFSDDEILTTFTRPPSSSSNSSVPEQWHSTFASPVALVGDLSSQLLLDTMEIDRRLALAGMNSGAEEDQIAADLMDVDSSSDEEDSIDLGMSDSDSDLSGF
ncbi:hypothetical protein C8J56DRAFT_1046629 [Mycena floridula]|nr:hypothetical protein C8J56DRAFT_1046629 [Mycena floridula]